MKCSALMGCCSAFRVFNPIRDENPPDLPSAPNTACPHSCAVPDEFVVSGSHFKTPLPVSKPERLVLSESTNSSSGKSVSSHSASRPKSASHLGRSTAGTTPGDSGWDSSSVTPSSVSVFDFSHSNRWRWPSANSTATTTTPPAAWYHSSSPGDAPVGQPFSAPPTTGVGVVASLSSAACHSHATCSPSRGPSHSDTHLPAPITITTIKTNSDRHNPTCARQDALSVATSAFHVPHNATSSSNAASSDSVCSPACRAPLLGSSTYAVSGNVTCSEAPIPYNSTNLLHPLPGTHIVMAASYNLHRDRVHSEDYGSNKKAEPTELESPTKSRPLTLNIRTKTSYGSMPVLTLLRTLPQPCYVSAAPRKECEQASVRALALPLLLTQTASPSCPCLPCMESAVQSENATPECTKGGNSARCSDSEPAGSSAPALRQPNESILIASSDVNHLCVSTSAGVSPIALGSIVTPNTTTTTARPLEEDKGDTHCVPLLGQTQPVPLQQSSAPRQRVTYSLPSSPQLSVGKFHQRDGTGNVLHKTFTSMHLPSLGPVGRGQYSGTDPRKTVTSETQNEPSVPSESARQESYTNQVVELIRDNQPHVNHVQGPQCKSLQGAVVILNGDRCSPFSSSSESSPSGMTADSTPTTAKDASSNSNVTGLIGGPRFKLLLEGDVQLCRLNHPRTVISKILSSKFLRRWESHHLYLNDACLSSKTPMGFMESSVPYSQMEEISIVLGWDAGHRFCLRIMLPHGSLLIQANNAYTRDQWYHSILWKKYVFRYHQVLRSTTRPDVLLKELKHMVDLATSTPLQDDCITQAPLEVISSLLSVETMALSKGLSEELLSTLAPLLERQHPSREMCSAFSRHCAMHPRSALVHGLFTTVVHRILKHNVDFGKNPYMRRFVQDYIRVVFAQNDGPDAIRAFVQSVHGAGSACPHPRVLPNLVAVCLAAVFAVYDARRQKLSWEHNNLNKLSPHRPDNYIKSWIQTKTLISQIQQQDGVTTHSASPLSSLLEQRISSPSSWIHASSQAQVHTQPCYTSPGHKRKTSTDSYTGTLSRDDMSENLLLVEEKPSTTTEPNTRGGSSSSGTTTSTSSSSAASPLHVDGDVFSLEWSEGVPSRSSNASLENISDTDMQLNCYLTVFQTISEYEDWRPSLAQLLQPIPFPDDALADAQFIKGMIPVIESVGTDSRCEVHQLVLGIREGKEGWFHVFCPSSAACPDEGTVWSGMLKTLLECCCRRKRFLATLTKWVGAFQLLALRDNGSAQDVLSLMLEWDLLEGNEEDKNALPMQVVTTLQSTASGRWKYAELCNRQLHLKALQQKGGPKKLTLPSRSTDADLEKMLSCGSFGNLECLSLAFTQVTSACAEHLIKLPSLRYLNLWSTQFGDSGLQLISEHLHKLQVLNLCETPVTDKGLTSLAVMKSLRKLNLNSTSLSAQTFEQLKQKLPSLQECDIRYTDAW